MASCGARAFRRVSVVVIAALTTTTLLAGAAARAGAAPNLGAVSVTLATVARGLSSPVAIAWRAGDARMYVVEQDGRVRIVNTNGTLVPQPVLTVAVAGGNEQGLLGLTFSANGTKLYVDYTDPSGTINIVEYTMAGDVGTAPRTLLTIPHPTYDNHNGGNIIFGPDGDLYIGTGDGGGSGDPNHNAQNLDSLLGKILRINPAPSGGLPYTIPGDNPFANTSGRRGEIWMYGLRNPWRFSFDVARDLWIGDVGQDLYEEVDVAGPGEKGINWGWPLREGFHAFDGAKPPGARDPLFEVSHSNGSCAIVGGFVYRGSAIPNLNGAYVYGDDCHPPLVGVAASGGRVISQVNLGPNVESLTTFGQDPHGELYAVSRTGVVFKLVFKPVSKPPPPARPVGYWIASGDGRVWGYHGAVSCNSARPTAVVPVIGLAGNATGYRTVALNGGVTTCREPFYGSMAGHHLYQAVRAIAATPTGRGYWLVATDGGIFSFGDAAFRGSTGNIRLNQPIVGMARTPSGRGYWLVASDGGIFAFGDAAFRGSTGNLRLDRPIVGMAPTRSGRGYWLVASDGGIFSFGDARFFGSLGGRPLPATLTGMAATPSGNGYWLVAANGSLYTFGDAHNFGSPVGARYIIAIAHN